MAIEIPLSKRNKSKHKGKYVALVSDEDRDLAELNWSASSGAKTKYATHQFEKGGKMMYMHRIILERMLGRPLEKGELVDHRDGNGLNNQRDNLRIATRSQNMINTGLKVTNTSGYKGVSWNSERQKWEAKICYLGEYYRLGYFDDLEEAGKARMKKEKELFGDFVKGE